MIQSDHRIHRQTIELSFTNQDTASDWQHKLDELNQNRILPMLDKIFTTIAGPDRLVILDRLEIDLDKIPAKNFESEFCTRFQERLGETLAQNLQVIPSKNDAGPVSPLSGEANGDHGQAANELSAVDQRRALLHFFLKTGQLPWWADSNSAEKMERLLLELMETAPADTRLLLREGLPDDRFRQRLIYQFSDQALHSIMQGLAGRHSGKLRAWMQDLEALIKACPKIGISAQDVRDWTWDYLLKDQLFVSVKPEDLLTAVIRFINDLGRSQQPGGGDVTAALNAGVRSLINERYQFVSGLPLWLAKANEGAESAATDTLKSPDPSDLSFAARHTGLRSGILDAAPYRELEQIRQIRRIDTAAAHPDILEETCSDVVVENAGLVLLWPFVNRFFSTLELLRDNRFIHLQSAMRAVHLLQYMVTARCDSPESYLALNKIFCGLAVTAPIIKSIDMTDVEKNECHMLLKSVINRWSVLKTTSIQGLQSAFLQREGMLTDRHDHWLLRVEHKSFDLLLEHLPWGKSMIQLSWMKKMLVVEWE